MGKVTQENRAGSGDFAVADRTASAAPGLEIVEVRAETEGQHELLRALRVLLEAHAADLSCAVAGGCKAAANFRMSAGELRQGAETRGFNDAPVPPADCLARSSRQPQTTANEPIDLGTDLRLH